MSFKFDENMFTFSIDWLHGTLPFYLDVDAFINKLSLLDPDKLSSARWVQWERGINHYSTRLCLNNKATISICYKQDDMVKFRRFAVSDGFNTGIFFMVSGDGIRYLGADLFARLMRFLWDNDFRCSRIDVNANLYDSENPIIPLYIESFKVYQTKDKRRGAPVLRCGTNKLELYTYYDTKRCQLVENFTVGDHKSERGMFRCYDKYYEITNGRLAAFADDFLRDKPATQYWYRLEFQMRDVNAQLLFDELASLRCTVYQAFLYCARHWAIYDIKYDFYRTDSCILFEEFLSFIAGLSEENSYFV